MKTRKQRRVTARYKWDRLRVNFWFAPVIMSLGAVLVAWTMYWLDERIPNELLQGSRFILSGAPGEIRTMLIGMAATILATAGVVFSLLTLPLSTVAAQYGSRLLRVFLGDRTTQLILGMFVATFVYCLAAALSIPPASVDPDGPQITVTVGLFLMLGTFGSLILLIQHISTTLQAPNIAAAAAAELRDVVRAEIQEDAGSAVQTGLEAVEKLVKTDSFAIRVKETGYIQYSDPHTLLTLAEENDLIINLKTRPGHFVWRETAVALVWPAAKVNEQLEEQILMAFRLGNSRTPTQDVTYAVNQLVEMAVRAMSAAINDPFTAMTCLDYIGEGLVLFIQQGARSSCYYDRNNRLRLILKPVTFVELLDSAFDMVRHASCDNASVLLHILETIDAVGQEASSLEIRQELLRHVSLIELESRAGQLIEADRQLIQRRTAALQTKLAEINSE